MAIRRAPRSAVPRLLLSFCLLPSAFCLPFAAPAPRTITSLNGPWLFQTNGAPADSWRTVQLPASFEAHEGTAFDGVGIYRRQLTPPSLRPDQRLLLHISAAATEAEVFWNGQSIGAHLGAWTPFRFDVTDLVRSKASNATHEIRIRVDEKVGHNTQGFLPVVQPHFGGLWQNLDLLVLPDVHIDDLSLHARGNPDTRQLELDFQLPATATTNAKATVRYRPNRDAPWQTHPVTATPSPLAPQGPRSFQASVPIDAPRRWSPEDPALYDVELELPGTPDQPGDVVSCRAAFRKIEAREHQLLLNGKPLNVRGLLNWGYYPAPERLALLTPNPQLPAPNSQLPAPTHADLSPNPPEALFRKDLEFARARGFNLIKFCLWIPPKRYLELADEMGLLAWIEYPTWHPDLTSPHLPDLRREFTEFFLHDRNHPSVILRSLTCETGAGADLNVIRELYNLAHACIPGALVEDDSSWIGWNRIHDFWDDHPYGNNHTWVSTLHRLTNHIATNSIKPLILGEAIAADTWVRPSDYAAFRPSPTPPASVPPNDSAPPAPIPNYPPPPYWLPGALEAQQRWADQFTADRTPLDLERLRLDSLRYALLTRKYQIETYRREVPHGGYVVSVLRDFPVASMGFIDALGRSKWHPLDWSWHGETMILLSTDSLRRSAFTRPWGPPPIPQSTGRRGARPEAPPWFQGFLVSHFGPEPLTNARAHIKLFDPRFAYRLIAQATHPNLQFQPGTRTAIPAVRSGHVDVAAPTRLRLTAELRAASLARTNEWLFWALPQPSQLTTAVWRHASLSQEDAEGLMLPRAQLLSAEPGPGVILTRRLDPPLADLLERGARVLLLPDGQPGSFPLEDHWFLRGGPVVPSHPLSIAVPRDFLVELQAFDLAGPVIPNLHYLAHIDPILLLWDTHDLRTVKTHGLAFETRVGDGRLLVSALRHQGPDNAAGAWLLHQFVGHLTTGPAPRHSVSSNQWLRVRARLRDPSLPFNPDTDLLR